MPLETVRAVLNTANANRKSRPGEDWKVILVCFLFASLAWLVTVMGKTYDHTINLPVRFDYDAESYVSAQPLPKRMQLQVEGIGWKLVLHEWGLAPDRLVIKPEWNEAAEAMVVTPKSVFEAAQRQISDLEVTYALGDSVNVVLEPLLRINLPLALETSELNLAPDYQLTSDVKLNPASLQVKGLKRHLAELPPVLPVRFNAHKTIDDVEEVVPLDLSAYKDLKFSQKEVLVMFSVGKFVPWHGIVPILDSANHALRRGSVLLNCLVDERDLATLKPDSFQVIMAPAVAGSRSGAVKLKHIPAHVRDARINLLGNVY